MTPEGKVKKEIKAYLDSIGAYHFWPVQTGYGAATLDCLACVRGAFVGIEVKAPGKKPTKRQELTIKTIWQYGGVAICVDNVDALRAFLEMQIGLEVVV